MTISEMFKMWRKKRTVRDIENKLQDRMTHIDEMMNLNEVTHVYAKYVCMMHNWRSACGDYLSNVFCEVSFSFMNGYIKALHDNGLKFERGLVKKRDIGEEMPCGALEYYRKDAIANTKQSCVAALQRVMERYETSKTNINTIVCAFKDEIKED